jgi:hypothetical protein
MTATEFLLQRSAIVGKFTASFPVAGTQALVTERPSVLFFA